jgi:hypothetical protein
MMSLGRMRAVKARGSRARSATITNRPLPQRLSALAIDREVEE